jgi:transketolase
MEIINKLKTSIVKSAFNSKEGHIPSALSILDILFVLYNKVLNIDKNDCNNETRDRFILSKGHASLALYAILAYKDFIKESELDDFGNFNSRLGGHPDKNKIPGVEASTGSLGHGLPFAVGIALAQKIVKSSVHTYVIIGDGESNEGTIWESALLASNHNLANLTCILDYNHSNDRALKLDNLVLKFESFGWHVLEINGHNHDEIEKALLHRNDKPIMIIANTIKGNGIPTMENNPAWHHKSPSETEFYEFIKILEKK